MAEVLLKQKTDGGDYLDHPLNKAVITVGRSKQCDVVVDDSSLSRLHMRLEQRGDRWFVVDNNSSNGTFLNRRKVNEAMLKDGDEVMTGRIHFTFAELVEESGDVTQPLSVATGPQVQETVAMGAMDMPLGAPPKPAAAPPPPPPPPPSDDSFDVALDKDADITQSGAAVGGPAPPVKRLIALLIDAGVGLVLYIPGMIITWFLSATLGTLLTLAGGLAAFLHVILGWHKYGKTVGKHVMGLRMIELENPGSEGLSIKAVVMRLIGWIVCSLPMGLLFLAILFDDEGRGIHDKIGGTRVVSQ